MIQLNVIVLIVLHLIRVYILYLVSHYIQIIHRKLMVPSSHFNIIQTSNLTVYSTAFFKFKMKIELFFVEIERVSGYACHNMLLNFLTPSACTYLVTFSRRYYVKLCRLKNLRKI